MNYALCHREERSDEAISIEMRLRSLSRAVFEIASPPNRRFAMTARDPSLAMTERAKWHKVQVGQIFFPLTLSIHCIYFNYYEYNSN